MYHTAFLTGMGTSAGLIIAIGAQNAYLLTQSVRRNHYVTIAVICAIFDVLFISVGVAGVGTFLNGSPLLMKIAAWGGASFLFFYGLMSFRSAFRKNTMNLLEQTDDSLKKVIVTTLAVTVLNPHVYIDTIVLMGGISAQFESYNRLMFAIGACLSSVIWFYLLAVAGTKLQGIFRKPVTWKLLDGSVGTVMWLIGLSLII
ncbi:Lysine exporter protein (LYSE/YGGA) [Denitrovibrio acetiphilus DSM 12809]|uniref:Lysine exporter protein (LYSE/YGGA) n=2 Tax=Denitrovibrio TaxID=117999 RepID=D4H6T6_DENA2|nr:Lysine exporter protein (LYSE/YGGA) [Denitrovibrio acetiphilus DSM 12809]